MQRRIFLRLATIMGVVLGTLIPPMVGEANPTDARGAGSVSKFGLRALVSGVPIPDAAREFAKIAAYVPNPRAIRAVGTFGVWRWYVAPGNGTRLCLISRGPGRLIGTACVPGETPYRGGVWVAKARSDYTQVVAMIVPDGYTRAQAPGSESGSRLRVRRNMIYIEQRRDVTVRLTGPRHKPLLYRVPDLIARRS